MTRRIDIQGCGSNETQGHAYRVLARCDILTGLDALGFRSPFPKMNDLRVSSVSRKQ